MRSRKTKEMRRDVKRQAFSRSADGLDPENRGFTEKGGSAAIAAGTPVGGRYHQVE